MRLQLSIYIETDVFDDLREQGLIEDRPPGYLIEQAWRAWRKLPTPERTIPKAKVVPERRVGPYLGRHRWAGTAHPTLGRKCAHCGLFRQGAPAECAGAPAVAS